jgi:hypothetical protein
MEYLKQVQDIEIDRNKDIVIGTHGDLDLISELDNIHQSVAIMVMQNTARYVGTPVTSNTLKNLETDILESLNQDPQIDPVRRVDIFAYDEAADEIELEITTTKNESFTTAMTLPDEMVDLGWDVQ